MEAVGVVAFIFGLSSFALELTKTLYDFGDAVASAKEDSHKIARNISNYTGVLDVLQESLHNDEPLYTQRALELADSLSKQSHTIFREIRETVTGSPPWDGFKWREKAQWAFRKSKVNALVEEIGHLKATLNLLLQTMILARQACLAPDKDKRYTIRAEQALYEQWDASERLSKLRSQIYEEEKMAGARGQSSSTTNSGGALVSYSDPVLSAFQHEYLHSDISSKEKAARLRVESLLWLDRLRAEWFDAKEAESHLSMRIVRKEPGSSSGSHAEDGSKRTERYEERLRDEFESLRKQFEKQLIELQEKLRSSQQSERLANEKYTNLQEKHDFFEREHQQRYTRLQAEHIRSEYKNREDLEKMYQEHQERLRLMMQQMQHL